MEAAGDFHRASRPQPLEGREAVFPPFCSRTEGKCPRRGCGAVSSAAHDVSRVVLALLHMQEPWLGGRQGFRSLEDIRKLGNSMAVATTAYATGSTFRCLVLFLHL